MSNSANKGMNVKNYLVFVVVAVVVLLAGALIFSRTIRMRRVDHPKPTTAISPQ